MTSVFGHRAALLLGVMFMAGSLAGCDKRLSSQSSVSSAPADRTVLPSNSSSPVAVDPTTPRIWAESSPNLLPCLTWADPKGTEFFKLHDNGLLQRVSYPLGAVSTARELKRKVTWLSLCAQGILVTCLDMNGKLEHPEVLLLNKDTFEDITSYKLAPGVVRVVSQPNWNTAVCTGMSLSAIDLVTGNVTAAMTPQLGTNAVNSPVLGVIGQKNSLFVTWGGVIHRYEVNGVKLDHMQASKIIGGGGFYLQVSPDSAWVCLPCPLGSTVIGHPNDVAVLKAANLNDPAMPFIENGAHPQVVGFDPVTKLIYLDDDQWDLIAVTSKGVPIPDQKWKWRDKPTDRVQQYLVHPEGGRLIIVVSGKLVPFDVPINF
jgi:hypothetical protein